MQRRTWFVVAGLVAVVALIIGLVAIFSSGTGPRGYVADHYTRAAHLDLRGDDDNRAYTSPKSVPAVAAEITAKWRPQSRADDASGVYLRYSDDAVIVRPHRGGSVIHLTDVDQAYRHYHGHLVAFWGPIGTHGETFRGRGPGAGK